MSDAVMPSPPQPLTPYQQRVLGVLVEKAKTTPDIYPMTINGLVTGCNQKSNRDPVMDLADDEVEDTLAELQKLGLVTCIQGGRVEKWRHQLYDVWVVNRRELAVLTELLLRGSQTLGDLRSRASRMEALESLEELREVMTPLVERGLVIYLTPEDRRGAVVTHGFHGPEVLAALRDGVSQPTETNVRPGGAGARPSPEALRALEERLTAQEAAMNQLREEVAELRTLVQTLRAIASDA